VNRGLEIEAMIEYARRRMLEDLSGDRLLIMNVAANGTHQRAETSVKLIGRWTLLGEITWGTEEYPGHPTGREIDQGMIGTTGTSSCASILCLKYLSKVLLAGLTSTSIESKEYLEYMLPVLATCYNYNALALIPREIKPLQYTYLMRTYPIDVEFGAWEHSRVSLVNRQHCCFLMNIGHVMFRYSVYLGIVFITAL